MTIRFNAEDERNLQIFAHAEFLKLKEGVSTDETWHVIVCRLNIGMVLAMSHFEAAAHSLRQGLDAMVSVKDRYARVSKWGISDSESQYVGQALNLTDEMQKQSTRRELRNSIKTVFLQGTA